MLPDGRVLTGLYDGRVVAIDPATERHTVVCDTGGRPLGLELHPDGGVVVCDAYRGVLLFVVDDGTTTELVTSVDGGAMMFCNNAAVARDGTIYFTDSSTKFGFEHWRGDLLEHGASGRRSGARRTARSTSSPTASPSPTASHSQWTSRTWSSPRQRGTPCGATSSPGPAPAASYRSLTRCRASPTTSPPAPTDSSGWRSPRRATRPSTCCCHARRSCVQSSGIAETRAAAGETPHPCAGLRRTR